MIEIATLTAAGYDWSHGPNFSQIINGCSEERARAAGMKFIPSSIRPLCDDARVVAIWTPDPDRTNVVARALDIPQILERSDEAVGEVDAIISSDDSCETWADSACLVSMGQPVSLSIPTNLKLQKNCFMSVRYRRRSNCFARDTCRSLTKSIWK